MALWDAITVSLASVGRRMAFVACTLAIFALIILVPVWTTPGNDVLFQLSLMSWWQMVLVVALSLGNALVLLLQWHLFRLRRSVRTRDVLTQTGLLASAVLATLACVACYSSLLAVFGLAGVLFVGKYHMGIVVVAVVLTVWALHHTARRVTGACTRCNDFRQR